MSSEAIRIVRAEHRKRHMDMSDEKYEAYFGEDRFANNFARNECVGMHVQESDQKDDFIVLPRAMVNEMIYNQRAILHTWDKLAILADTFDKGLPVHMIGDVEDFVCPIAPELSHIIAESSLLRGGGGGRGGAPRRRAMPTLWSRRSRRARSATDKTARIVRGLRLNRRGTVAGDRPTGGCS
jgi:hypothetical protein